MKRYGLILADNGSPWFFSGTSDVRWSDDELNQLKRLRGRNFEVVDTSHLRTAEGRYSSIPVVRRRRVWTSTFASRPSCAVLDQRDQPARHEASGANRRTATRHLADLDHAAAGGHLQPSSVACRLDHERLGALPGIDALTADAIHRHGSLAALELSHCGLNIMNAITREDVLGPSSLRLRLYFPRCPSPASAGPWTRPT